MNTEVPIKMNTEVPLKMNTEVPFEYKNRHTTALSLCVGDDPILSCLYTLS